MKLHTVPFIGAKFDNDIWDFYRRKIWRRHEYFFIDSPGQKSFCFRTYEYEYSPNLALIPFEQVLDLVEKYFS